MDGQKLNYITCLSNFSLYPMMINQTSCGFGLFVKQIKTFQDVMLGSRVIRLFFYEN